MLHHVKTIDKQLERVDWEVLSRRTGFQKRAPRKIKARDFIKCLCAGVLQHRISFSSLASLLSFISGSCVSKQALSKRINGSCVTFVRDVLFTVIGNLCGLRRPLEERAFRPFRRVLIQDSTNLALPNHLADTFPGARNQRRQIKATMKIQSVYDLLSGYVIHFTISGFTRTDQAASPDILTIAQKGDLVLRDLGYFVLSVFKRIHENGAFFLSRLRHKVALYDPSSGERIDLLAKLRKSPILDIDVVVGDKERLPVRLVAVPVPESVANERRRKAKNNRDRRCRPSKQSLALLGWQIFITNVERSVWDTKTAATIYGIRWRIEIIFKAWKSHFQLKNVPSGSSAQVEACVLAKLLYLTLFQAFFHEINQYMTDKYTRPLSILKTAALFSSLPMIVQMILSADKMPLIEDILRTHCSYEKRNRRLNFAEELSALS